MSGLLKFVAVLIATLVTCWGLAGITPRVHETLYHVQRLNFGITYMMAAFVVFMLVWWRVIFAK
jgi:hypothetical protein